VSDVVADKIRELRKERHWRVTDLADRCKERGADYLTANVIENIESGRRDQDGNRRRAITVDELYAFAEALGVPPLRLLITQGTDGEWAETFGTLESFAREAQRFMDDMGRIKSVRELGAVLEDPAVVEAIEQARHRAG
jgi:transcriptional regulator with XRE-family HTH domain